MSRDGEGADPGPDSPTDPLAEDPSDPQPPKTATKKRSGGWRRSALRLGCGVGLLALIGVAGITGTGAWLLTPGGQDRLAREVEGLVTGLMAEGELTIGGLSTNLISRVGVDDVALLDGDGREVVRVERAEARLDLLSLVGLTVRVPSLDVSGVDADLRLDEEGTLDVARLFATEPDPDAPPFEGLPVDLLFEAIQISDSRVSLSGPDLDPIVVEDLRLGGSFTGSGLRFDVQDLDLDGRVDTLLPGPLRIDGDFTWQGAGIAGVDLVARLRDNAAAIRGHARDLGGLSEPPGSPADPDGVDLIAEIRRLDLPDVDAFANAGLSGRVGGRVTLKGPVDGLTVQADLDGQDGTRAELGVQGLLDARVPSWDATVGVDDLHVEDLITSLTEPTPVSVKARLSGSGAAWPDALTVDGEILEGQTRVMGVQVDRIGGSIGVDQGMIRVDELDVAGPVGQVTGSATFDPESGALELDLHAEDVDPSRLRDFQVPAELDGSRATADVKVAMAVYAEEVDVRVDGTGTVAPLRWTESIRARRATGDYTVQISGTDVDVVANARAVDILAYGARVEQAASRGIEVAVRSDRVTAGGAIRASNTVYALIPDSLVADLGRGVEVDEGTGRWDVDVPLDPDTDEPMTVDVGLDLGPHRLLRYPGQSGRLTVAMVGDEVNVIAALDATSTRRLADVDMELDLQTLAFSFPTLQIAPEPRQTWTAAPGGSFQVTEAGGVRDLDLLLRSARGEIEVRGDLDLEGEQDLAVEVYDLDLLAVARLLPMWLDGLQGYAGGRIALTGTAQDPQLIADIEVADVAWESAGEEGPVPVVQAIGGRLVFEGDGDAMDVDGDVLVDGMPLVSLDVTAPVSVAFDRAGLDPEGPMQAEIRAMPGGLLRIGEMLGIVLPVTGQLEGRLLLDGTPVSPTGQLAASAILPVKALGEDVTVDLALEKGAGGVVTWQGTAREGRQTRIKLSGRGRTEADRMLAYLLGAQADEPDWERPSLYLDGLKSSLKLDALPLQSIVLASGTSLDLGGDLSGSFTIGGSAISPRVDGDLSIARGRVGTVKLSDARLSMRGDDRGYTLAATADMNQDSGRLQGAALGSIYAAGRVPLVVDLAHGYETWARGPLDISVDVDVPLAVASAYDRGVKDAVGFIEVDGGIAGPIFDPEPYLGIRTSEGAAVTYSPVGVRFRDLVLDVIFDKHAVQVVEMSTQTRPSRVRVDTAISGVLSGAFRSGGDAVDGIGNLLQGESRDEGPRRNLSVSGTAHLQEWTVDALDLTARLDQALLLGTSDQLLRLSTGKPLTVKGPLMQPRVRGSLSVDEANVFLDYAKAQGGSVKQLDSRITVHRGAGSSSTEVAEGSLLDDADIEVAIDLGRATRGRLIMPLEAIQWLGTTAEKILQVDVRARLQSTEDLVYRQVPCRVRTRGGRMRKVPGRQGACGLYHPQVTGVVGIVDGEARVLRADFVLSDSQVRFLGGEVYNPNLDIHGEMDVEDQQNITLDITGTAYDPEIVFGPTSNDQIFATLALGTSLDGLTAQQVASAVGMALLNTALADVSLPSVNIDPRGKVQVGLAVTRDVFVELTAGGTPRPDENVFEAEVEYAVAKGLLVTAGFGAYAVPFWSDVLLQRTFD